MPLRVRITLGVALASALIVILSAGFGAWALRASADGVLRVHLQTAKGAAARLARTFDTWRGRLRVLARDLPATSPPLSPASAGEWVRGRSIQPFAALALLSADGRVLWSHPLGWLAGDLAGQTTACLQAPALTYQTGVVPGLLADPHENRFAAFVQPLADTTVLLGAVPLSQERFSSIVGPSGDSRDAAIEVINPCGTVLVSSERADVGRPSEHLPVIAPLVHASRPGIALHPLAGAPHYVASAPVPGYAGWAVNVEHAHDLAAVMLALPRLWPGAAALGAAVVATLSTLAFLDVGRVIRPLERLRHGTARIARGDLDHPIAVERQDEIGALARAFEAMRAALRSSREEIVAWNRELETRVAGRTRDLETMTADNARLLALSRRDERNLASTVDLLSDGLLTLDLDRRIQSLNPAAERLLGWSSVEAQGLMCTDLLACPGCEGGSAESICALKAALAPEGSVRGVRVRARHRRGDTFPVFLTAGIGRDEHGDPTHFIVTIKDMTAEEAYERRLQRQIHQLTLLHAVAQGLNLMPLRGVRDTAPDIVRIIADATGGRCCLDLDGRGRWTAHAPAGALSSDPSYEASPEDDPDGLASEPVVVQGRRIGSLWLDPERAGSGTEAPGPARIIATQVAVAAENAILYEDVRDRDALRRQLLDRIVTIQEEERHRIARELHDEIGQVLAALVMQLGAAEGALPSGASDVRDRLAEVRTLVSHTVGEVRRLMLDLRPSMLDELGLVPAIRWYVESHVFPAGLDGRVSLSGVTEHERLPRRLELVAFRLTQEAVTNILRHARATRVNITLERQNGTLILSIGDDGKGFDPRDHSHPGPGGGWGLAGMRERVALLGGTLTVTSRGGHGTHVTAAIPIREDADAG